MYMTVPFFTVICVCAQGVDKSAMYDLSKGSYFCGRGIYKDFAI